jgi:nicotinamidase-related amidase
MASALNLHPQQSENARRRLRAEDCALLVVDIQQKLLPPIHEGARLVRNAQLLIRLAKILKLPIIATTQYKKGLGDIVPEISELLPASPVLDKLQFGCFGDAPFCSALKQLAPERNTLLLSGMETHICVMQTALGALENGYLVHVASDAVSSRSELNWRVGLERMQSAGALLSSTEMMIYELLGGSSTPAFKEMLQYLK